MGTSNTLAQSWAGPAREPSINRDMLLDEINEGIADHLGVNSYHSESFITEKDLTNVTNAMMLVRNNMVAKIAERIKPGSTDDY